MKNKIYVVLVGCLFSCFVNSAEPQYVESLYMFNAGVPTLFENPLDETECGWAAGFLGPYTLEGGGIRTLYSVQTKKTSGEILKGDIKGIGELVFCYSEGYPVNERGLLLGEAGFIWRLTLNNQVYLVGGAARYRTNPPDFPPYFPEEAGLLGSTGTILLPSDIFTPVGSMTTNALVPFGENEDYEANSLVTVRLYTPNPNAD